MRNLKPFLFSIAISFPFFTSYGQITRIGSGTCINFPGTSSNEHVDLDTIANVFATSDFTIEFWERLDTSATASSDIPFICNKDWALGKFHYRSWFSI
jgi:hypothetical protein